MSCIWISAQECSKVALFQLTELINKDRELQIIVSFEPPAAKRDGNDPDQKIEEVLSQMGISTNLKGWQYLRSAVRRCMDDREELDGITKRLYPSVAKEHKTTADKVEYAIRHAIEISWQKGNEEALEGIFGCDARGTRRPTNAEFISRIADYVNDCGQPMYSH